MSPSFSLRVSSKREDHKKLVCLLKFLNGTVFLLLKLSSTLITAITRAKIVIFAVPRKISRDNFPQRHLSCRLSFVHLPFRFDRIFALSVLIINGHAINVFNHSLGNLEPLSCTKFLSWYTNFPRQSFESCSIIHDYF